MANETKELAARKEGRKRGEITQKMVSFRLDSDLAGWLSRFQNKGRYINNLIRKDMNLLNMNGE